jgi:hypothetical protein
MSVGYSELCAEASRQFFLERTMRFSQKGLPMPQIALKETITRKIDIPLNMLVEIVNNLSADDKRNLLSRISLSDESFKKFKKDKLSVILADLSETQLYEPEFLADIEAGLKKSSVYR